MAKEKRKLNSSMNQSPVQKQDVDSTPAFNVDTFSSLRDKIQAKLKHKKPPTPKHKTAQSKNPNDQSQREKSSRGKKRSSDGTVLDQDNPSKSIKSIAQKADETIDDAELRKIVKELGGTDEDLDLITGVDSDSEVEGLRAAPVADKKSKDGKSLEQGISNILKEIALAQGTRARGLSDTDEEETEETDEDGDQSSKVEIPGNEEQAQAQAQTQAQAHILQPHTDGARKKTTKDRFKCEPRPDWYVAMSEIDLSKEISRKPTQQSIDALHTFARSLLDGENETFRTTQQSSSSQSFYNTVIASGTLSDRISALTLAVQESPLHNIKALELLIGLAGKRSRAQAIEVLRALKDLFAQGSLLPSDRRLYTFSSNPLILSALGRVPSWKNGNALPSGLDEPDLICLAFEDFVKEKYFEVLKILEVWCNDEIEYSRSRAVSFVYELLKEKPEQESNLLRLLVNKIGDPVKKIASQTSYFLMQLLISHPAMKMVVISFVESDFLFRPGQSIHGQYYAVTTLNQTALSSREEDVANKLLDIYFSLFTSLLKSTKDSSQDATQKVVSTSRAQRQRQKPRGKLETPNLQVEELTEKLISAILTGVNRAYPYAGTDQKNFDKHLDTLFQITHSANFNTSVQAMMLLQQLTATHGAAADRFYRTLYESLLDLRLVTTSNKQLYLNILHRSLKADLNAKRVKAFAKRILQILSLYDPSFVCGSFFLLKDLESAFPSLSAMLNQAEQHDEDDDGGEEAFYDVDEDAVMQEQKPARTDTSNKKSLYDGSKRAPEHANADQSCIWEVLPFLAHYHPSVSVTTNHYMQQKKLPGKPDLSLHTLIHFLDRFVYRNPKLANNQLRGASIMQPMANDDTHAVLISSSADTSGPAVNTEAFKNQKDTDVAAADVFFHKYFSALGKDSRTKKPRRIRDMDEEGSNEEDDEDAVWKAMIDSAPDLEGASSEEDFDMSSFDEDSDDDGVMDDVSAIDDDDSDSGVDIEAGIFDDEDVDDDLVPIPEHLVDSDVSEDDADFTAFDKEQHDIKKRTSEPKKGKKAKSLPTFASAADYAKMIENDDDEDLG